MEKNALNKYEKLYRDIDELLGDSEPHRRLGGSALKHTTQLTSCTPTPEGSNDIMAQKIKTFAAVIMPHFPKVA